MREARVKLVRAEGLERRQATDYTQVIDFRNGTIATISWFGGKLVRIETRPVCHLPPASLHIASLRRFADFSAKWKVPPKTKLWPTIRQKF